MSLRVVRSQGLGRITAIIAAMMIALATMFAFTSMPQQALAADDSQTNFDSWTEVAANIEKQLETAEQDYNDGNYYQAGTDFQNAHWVGYDASNFSKVVNDTIGADKQKALLQEFTDLESLAYQQDQGDAITAKVDALTADLNATAQTLDADTSLADPKTYAKQRAEETAKERKKLDAAKKNSSKGKGDRTWSDVASEMNVILDKAYKAAISGKGAEGSSLVNNAYYQYYEKLGFECEGIYPNGEDRCTFLHLNNLTLEVWTMDQPANATGAINHFALDVTDIDKAFEEAEKLGLNFVEGSVQHIDTFHENGIRYFNVLGPNHETIEFCQVL